MNFLGFLCQQMWCLDSPDSRVRPLTASLQGPAPMALKAWICSSYSVHSCSSSTVHSRARRSPMTFSRAGAGGSTRHTLILYPTDSGFPLYCVSGRGWRVTQQNTTFPSEHTAGAFHAASRGCLNPRKATGRQKTSRG